MRTVRLITIVALLGALVGILGAPGAGATQGVDQVGGYIFKDSLQPGGPTFLPRNANTPLTFANTDDGEATVALPFSFDFYGVTRSAMTVSPNGAVVFPGAQEVSFANAALSTRNQDMIAPLWDDWVVNGDVSTGLSGTAPNRVYVVDWDDVRPFGGTAADAVDFQLQLYENGDHIEFHYIDTDSDAVHTRGSSATVGIDHLNVSDLQYSLNTASISDGLAIRFSPVFCGGLRPTVTGTFGPDIINGTAGNDVILALGGNDVVDAGEGDDLVCGAGGDDVIDLRGGNDRSLGGRGNDRLFGRAGNDILDGGPGNDILKGGKDLDICVGGAGVDSAASCESLSSIP